MGQNVTQKLIESHLVEGEMVPGEEIALRIDQTLTQDATGTMVMLELEAMNLDRVKTELSAQYVDHNLLQTDFKNADDHLFLQSACEQFGLWFSRAGNGVSHPVHMERFGVPGKTLLGSDSHTPAAGSMGMLAIGAGGIEVAMAMAGHPYHLTMPKVFGVELISSLPDWVSAKDIILEMLRRYSVKGGVGWVFEFYGPGLNSLSAMDRHVIANMGTELGATSTVFPSDEKVRDFLRYHGREDQWIELKKDENAVYDDQITLDLSQLEPMIACPSSPDNVVAVSEVAGKEIYQAMVGSSANPGFRDFAISALMLDGRQVDSDVSLDVNPTSRQILEDLVRTGMLEKLITSGARIHQPGCNGCIGMGQAPATGRISLRTVPRNFPGRSGTKEDSVYLCSPEVATASAMTGKITDPRTLNFPYPKVDEPEAPGKYHSDLVPPPEKRSEEGLIKGPNIKPLPDFNALENTIKGPVTLKVGNNISTDEILPAGTRVLPFRSNIPEISKFTFYQVDENFYDRALPFQEKGQFIIGGINYGQGSSREHAAIAPRYLGVRAVIAKSFARIHQQNLINFGILPLTFDNAADYDTIDAEDILEIPNVREAIQAGNEVEVINTSKSLRYKTKHAMSPRQLAIILDGGIINHLKKSIN